MRPPFVVVANHSSHLDAPLIIGALPRRLARYLAAGAAADYFFDVWWRRGLTALFFNAFPVDRSGVNPRSVSAKMLLERGVPLLVFPEGTRSKERRARHLQVRAPPRSPSATGVPCLPVALIGAGIAHPRGSKWPKPGRLPGRGRVRCADHARRRARAPATSRPASAPRSCVCATPTQTVSLARRMPHEGAHA